MTSIPATYSLSELAAAAGLPVGTVKYYRREGLLAEGRLRSATRADYDEEHLRRLRLLRVLREVGDVPIERLRALVDALEATGGPLAVLGAGAEAMASPVDAPSDPAAAALVDRMLHETGWDLPPGCTPRAELEAVVAAALAHEDVGPGLVEPALREYAAVADRLGAHDVAALDAEDPADLLAQMVVGQVIYGRLLDVLRRIAEQHHAGRRWG